MSKPSNELDRRRVVQSVGVVGLATGLAGCSALWDQPAATDVSLRNVADTSLTVSMSVTGDGDDDPHTDRTLDLEPHEYVDAVNDGKIPLNSSYTVKVSVEGGPSETFDWNGSTRDYAPLHVVVDDGDNIYFLLQAG